MSAGFTSPLIQLLRSSDGMGLPSKAAWLARLFASSSHVQLSANSPAKTPSATRATEQNVMSNDLPLVMWKWLAGSPVTATVNWPRRRPFQLHTPSSRLPRLSPENPNTMPNGVQAVGG